MTIADLVAAPDRRQVPLKSVAHIEFQLRVLGLLCAAAAQTPTALPMPGSLDLWSRFIAVNRGVLACGDCGSAALDVAESIDVEVAAGMSIRRMRNQVFHGGPDPENVDPDALYDLVSANADRIVTINAHGHVTRLEPFFIKISGELAALNDYSGEFATYWPRRGAAVDVTELEVLNALQQQAPQNGDRLLQGFALDIQKDLRGFAERGSIQTFVVPPEPIVARWDLRTSGGTTRRVDKFRIGANHSRIWQSGSGTKPYQAFLADICNWPLLKERLLEELEERVETESRISEELFPELKSLIPDVPARVRVTGGRRGDSSNKTMTEACAQIMTQTSNYNSYTNLVTLTGEAGSGKTHSLLQFARESLSRSDKLGPIAIYISSGGATANSLDTLLDARMARTRILDKSSALALCRAGLAILVIDGFDELLGFRTYDHPLNALKPILDALRGRGTIILSARSSYSEARLRQNLERHVALDWQPYVTALELLPWDPKQLRELTSQLSVHVAENDAPPEVRQMLITPFFCLAFAAWTRSGRPTMFLQSVVDAYLQRERRKLAGQGGIELFDSQALADIFSEVAEMAARNAVPEVSEEDLELAASQALGRDLTGEEKRRLIALCGMSAEWAENDLSFKFTHLAVAEQFLARQVTRLPLKQAISLLLNVPISALCAQLIVSVWQAEHEDVPGDLVAALQEAVTGTDLYEPRMPGAISLGELWAKVYGASDGPRFARRITVEDMDLGGSGQVTLEDAHIQNLTVGPDVKILLTSGRISRLDLTKSSGTALIGESFKQIFELLTQTELAVGPLPIRRALGLSDNTDDDLSDIDRYFKSNISFARRPIVVALRDYSPDDDDPGFKWILAYGLDVWQGFVRRMTEQGQVSLLRVTTKGHRKVRLRLTDKFYE